METRARPIQVRPRKGSELERVQTELQNNMADTLHSWAEQFARLTKENGDERDE